MSPIMVIVGCVVIVAQIGSVISYAFYLRTGDIGWVEASFSLAGVSMVSLALFVLVALIQGGLR